MCDMSVHKVVRVCEFVVLYDCSWGTCKEPGALMVEALKGRRGIDCICVLICVGEDNCMVYTLMVLYLISY